jgi:23S rRNA pseudouridine2604 synthase
VPVGKYRELTDAEIKSLNKLIEPSSKTEEASLPKEKIQGTGFREQRERKPESKGQNTDERLHPNERRPATNNQPPATNSQRKIEIIKKDDPRFRKKGNY